MKNFLSILSVLIISVLAVPSYALYGNYDEFAQEEAEYKTPLIIPKGSIFRGFMGETVSSEFNNEGDIIKVLIPSDFIFDNEIIVPKNSIFLAQVKNLEKAQQGRNGLFSVDIIGLVFPDGRKYEIKGYIPSGKNNRVFGGEFARRSGHKTVLHRASPNGRKGVMQLLQNGPRIMGKETMLRMGDFVTIIIEEPINVTIY